MLDKSVAEEISERKKEPEWMLKLRLNALRRFNEMKMPEWPVPNLAEIRFDEINYYTPQSVKSSSWEKVPEYMRAIYEKMGIPAAERELLVGGSIAQYQSESIYEKIMKDWERKGVIFMSLDRALSEHPKLVRKYFSNAVKIDDNKFSALHYAVWSGGSFLYVPKGVKVGVPMQIYFYMKSKNEGQFEHTLIIADEGSSVHYIEGCSAPLYDKSSLHSAVVEVFAHNNSHVRYTTIQNWSRNVYNMNTKRALVHDNALVEWVGASLGSKVSMLYPCSVLLGRGAKSSSFSITLAPKGTVKEGGAKMIHLASNTKSIILSKSISLEGGHSVYRGLVKIGKGATNSSCNVKCDSVLIGDDAKTDTYPYSDIQESDHVQFSHEAKTGRISEHVLSYMRSRGIRESDAITMYINGFIKPVLEQIPLEYAIELNRFIQIELEDVDNVEN